MSASGPFSGYVAWADVQAELHLCYLHTTEASFPMMRLILLCREYLSQS